MKNIPLRYTLHHMVLGQVVRYGGWILIRRTTKTIDVYHSGYNLRVCRISGTNRANLTNNVYSYVTTHRAKITPIYALQFTLEGVRDLEDILITVSESEAGELAA